MNSPVLELRGLTRSFEQGGVRIDVLRGVDLSIATGERVAIVGQSGVGKSTLLHILGTLDRPSQGRVLFRGADVFDKPSDELASFRNTTLGFVGELSRSP